jgi:hypothetical protein
MKGLSTMNLVSCTTISLIQIGAVVSAALAAVFWARAAMVRVPPAGDGEAVAAALRRQSRLNAIAAGCAAVAAIFQCVLAYSPNCIKLT